MSTYAVQGETLGLIADAIRGKLGTDEPMEVSSFASAIESIPSGGMIDSGTHIPTSQFDNTITHNLGVKPNLVFIIPDDEQELQVGEVGVVGCDVPYFHKFGIVAEVRNAGTNPTYVLATDSAFITFGDTSFTIGYRSANYRLIPNFKYKWVAMKI